MCFCYLAQPDNAANTLCAWLWWCPRCSVEKLIYQLGYLPPNPFVNAGTAL
jgi:hypothetical protein